MRKAGKVGAYIASVSLLDRFLVVYLVLFLIHIIYALFSGKAVSTQMNSIDVVLRTFASAVYGYFLSGILQKRKIIFCPKRTESSFRRLINHQTKLQTVRLE